MTSPLHRKSFDFLCIFLKLFYVQNYFFKKFFLKEKLRIPGDELLFYIYNFIIIINGNESTSIHVVYSLLFQQGYNH